MLRLTYLAALRKIQKKDEELQQKLKTFEEISQNIEKNNKEAMASFKKSFGVKNH